MPVQFRTVQIDVPGGAGTPAPGPGGTKWKQMEGVADFNGRVERADCALKSFKFDYLGNPAHAQVDHQMNMVEVDPVVISTINDKVNLRVTCRYADKNFDDFYTGVIRVLVIGVVE